MRHLRATIVVCAALVLAVANPGPIRAAGAVGQGCDYGPQPTNPAIAPSLNLVSNGWLDTGTINNGQLSVKATILVSSLSATPAANVPAGASAASWELRADNVNQRSTSSGASAIYFRMVIDGTTGVPRYEAGWIEAAAVAGGQRVMLPDTPVNGQIVPGTPGAIVIEAQANQLGFEASGPGFGDRVTDVWSQTNSSATTLLGDNSATSTLTDRAPATGTSPGIFRVTAANHSCIPVDTWPTQTAALKADAFADSLGVNVRLDYAPSNYNGGVDPVIAKGKNYPQVENALRAGHFRYMRDFMDSGTPADKEYGQFYKDLGVKTDFTFQQGFTTDQVLASLRAQAPYVVSVEGVNEPDCVGCTSVPDSAFPTPEIANQQAVWNAVHAEPALAGIQVLPPPLATPQGYAKLGDVSAISDAGNLHTYAYTEPYTRAGLLDEWLGLTQTYVTKTKPVQMTETGYMTQSVPGAPGMDQNSFVVSEKVQAAYLPKTLLANLASGVSRTYITELLDEGPVIPGDLGHFGLVRSDWTPKPALTAIGNLATLLAEPSTTVFTPGSLGYTVAGRRLRHLLFQKADGSFWLGLWQDTRLYSSQIASRDGLLYGDLAQSSAPATLSFATPMNTATYVPNTSTAAVSNTTATTSLALNVPPDAVMLIKITTPGTPAAPAPGRRH